MRTCISWRYGLTLRVDEKSLLAGSGMSANNGMSVNNRLTSLDAVSGRSRVDLLDTRVRGLETVQTFLEQRTETLVSRSGIDKQSVASGLGLVKDIQKRRARGLSLVGDI